MRVVEPMDTPGLLGLTLLHTQMKRRPFVTWNFEERMFVSDVTYQDVWKYDPYYSCWTGFSLEWVLQNHYGWFVWLSNGPMYWCYRNQDFNIYIPQYSPEV